MKIKPRPQARQDNAKRGSNKRPGGMTSTINCRLYIRDGIKRVVNRL